MTLCRAALTGALLAFPLFCQTDGLKLTPGFDLTAIDRKAQPCEDFYQFSCGTWLANNPIPGDQSRWGRFSELDERNRTILRRILEQAAAAKNPDANTKKIGDYYASCMDEAGIAAKGLAPMKVELDRIAAMKTPQDMTAVIARLHMIAVNVLFNFTSGQDFKDSNAVIGQTDQAGLGLPERDYYFRTDAKAVDTRKEYVAYLERVLGLMGVPAAATATRAAAVMELETALAKVSLDVTSRRDPSKVYHLMKTSELQALSDSFNWTRYFTLVSAPKMDKLNVAVPDFFKGQEVLLKKTPLDVWKDYLSLHLVIAQSTLLPKAFDEANFNFFSKYLRGTKEQQPRWKRCSQAADGDLGEAVGIAYVQQTFGQEGKDRMLAMVKNLEVALGKDIQQLSWMTPATKQKAMEKLHAITNKIGYPDKWRDYSKLRIVRGDALGNSLRANEFEISRQIQKINKPIDRGEWFMTPPTVNAYYDPQMNNVNFPAGIRQPPFFDKAADDATNYGAIGAVIGHELTHGFDDQGRQFDAKGNLEDWWTDADGKSFEERAECFVKQYGAFELPGGVKLNGKLTLGENSADNGGLRVAMMALMESLAAKSLPAKEGFSPEQRFFLGWGQVWCQNSTPEVQRLQAQTDPHSLPRFRVNGVVQNMPEFQSAFGCKPGQPMAKGADSCRVW